MGEIKLPEPALVGTRYADGALDQSSVQSKKPTNREFLADYAEKGWEFVPLYTADQLRAAVEADRARRTSLPAGYQAHRLTLGEHQVLREAISDSAEVVAHGRLAEPEQPARKPLTRADYENKSEYLGCTSAVMRHGFEDGVRFAERMHGIGE